MITLFVSLQVCRDRRCQNASFAELETCIARCHGNGVGTSILPACCPFVCAVFTSCRVFRYILYGFSVSSVLVPSTQPEPETCLFCLFSKFFQDGFAFPYCATDVLQEVKDVLHGSRLPLGRLLLSSLSPGILLLSQRTVAFSSHMLPGCPVPM